MRGGTGRGSQLAVVEAGTCFFLSWLVNSIERGGFCRVTHRPSPPSVVCPVVAVVQWRQEISRFVRPGALRVVVYHGPKRGGTQQEELEAADVVITTYRWAMACARGSCRHASPSGPPWSLGRDSLVAPLPPSCPQRAGAGLPPLLHAQ